MSAQSSPEGPLPAKDSQLLFAAGESPTVEAGMQARRAALLIINRHPPFVYRVLFRRGAAR